MCKERSRNSFHYCGGPVKLVQSCLCARKDLESSFHHSAGPVEIVQACLSAGKVWYRRFNRRWGAVKHVQASLRWHGRPSAEVNENINLGYSQDQGYS